MMDQEVVRAAIAETGWIDVGEQSLTTQLSGIKVLLAGTEASWIGTSPDVPPRSSELLRIWLSHSPDQGDFAKQPEFDEMLSGHNHGSQVRLRMIGPVYSLSKFGVQYSGLSYEHGEMLIHVSRGVGAMDPFRWNCRPKITLLEFEF